MVGGTKRLPRAVREQQMLDAAVRVFADHGFRDTSMDAIAAEAEAPKEAEAEVPATEAAPSPTLVATGPILVPGCCPVKSPIRSSR